MKLNKNDVVEFVYNGGSHPGSLRKVLVNNDGELTFDGIDLEKISPHRSNFRQFSKDKVSNLVVVGHQEHVHFVEARQKLYDAINNLHGDHLAELYGKLVGTDDTVWNPVTGEVVTVIPVLKKKFPVHLTFQVDVVVNEESDSEENARSYVVDYLLAGEDSNDIGPEILRSAFDHAENVKIRLLDS